ncbi:hypothetical protein DOK78_000648 [Enterococcus sp. DIV2402]|uniref:VOC domain-containing protein n=1 Tax=Candidatus Enterococcus lowellii TaxID=2230877 RepID=A0ABZ2SLK8_9ENTE|nr:VOC family protein [Enterococcus sp. DIV2402]MBO0465556.1 VOC family protein [Enterococcus sp. DIV2402]
MIHHIELYVRDLAETQQFYDFLLSELNYSIYQQWDNGISYKFEDTYIVFVQVTAAYKNNGYHRKNIGLNHLAFQVNSTSQVNHLRKKLLARGTQELYAELYPFAGGPTHYAFYFEDPDRLKLEIVAEPK